MRLLIDHFLERDSLFHNWHPTAKLVGLGILIAAVACLRSLPAAGLGWLLSVALLPMTQIPLRIIWRRLRTALLFLLLFFVLLPFFGGGDRVSVGPMWISPSGLHLACLIFLKASAIVFLSIPLIATAPFDCLLKSLRQVGCPSRLVQIFLMTFRFNFVLAAEMESIGMALAGRGLKRGFNRPTFRALGGAVGSLLVRSHDRSQRLYDAMLARGYTGHVNTLWEYRVKAVDLAKLGAFVLLTIIIVGIEWWR